MMIADLNLHLLRKQTNTDCSVDVWALTLLLLSWLDIKATKPTQASRS